MFNANKLTSIIIDDEPKSQRTLLNMLVTYLPMVHNLASFDNLSQAVSFIQNENPDLIFLDIELQGESGLDIVKYFPKLNFDIIFITAYEQYALEAIKLSAIDYLLKPIGISELKNAVSHLLDKRQFHLGNEFTSIDAKKIHKLAVHTPHGFSLVNLDDIIFFEADHNYTMIYLLNNQKILANNTLRHYEDLLNHQPFFRINRSEIINLNYIKDFSKNNQGEITLQTGQILNLSMSRKEEFLQAINRISF